MTLPPAGEGLFIAIIAAVGGWIANRAVGKAAIQGVIDAQFKTIMAQRDRQENDLLRRLAAMEEKHTVQERAAAQERESLRGEVANLVQVIIGLEDLLRRNGIDVPFRRHTPPEMISLSSTRNREPRQIDDHPAADET